MPPSTTAESPGLMTYEDLMERWQLCARQVRRVCRRWKLIPMDMGHRTKRFRPADVIRAEERMCGEGQRHRYL